MSDERVSRLTIKVLNDGVYIALFLSSLLNFRSRATFGCAENGPLLHHSSDISTYLAVP
jgi:hypothetical protein